MEYPSYACSEGVALFIYSEFDTSFQTLIYRLILLQEKEILGKNCTAGRETSSEAMQLWKSVKGMAKHEFEKSFL